jgi:hydrogenase maturation protein HypF
MAYQSQHLGDLENLTGLEFFRESLSHLMRTFEIEPSAVVHDLHPGYLSTQWARQWAAERGLPLVAVQHHHAHIAGCMAEHGVEEAVGLALDGTGYGTDGRIWGGEVLVVRQHGASFERFAHLDYAPMPGGDAAVKEPWRMALAALHAAGVDLFDPRILTRLGVQEREARLVERMIERRINSPLTSSLGRLFDAVAALVLGRGRVDYEAQAAIELEGVAINEEDRIRNQAYVPGLNEKGILKTDVLVKAVLEDLARGVRVERIAAQFHAGVAEGFVAAAARACAETGIGAVALSGGCLHNRRLARLLRIGLEEKELRVLSHRHVSPGDGGLSYGQAVVAAARLALAAKMD